MSGIVRTGTDAVWVNMDMTGTLSGLPEEGNSVRRLRAQNVLFSQGEAWARGLACRRAFGGR